MYMFYYINVFKSHINHHCKMEYALQGKDGKVKRYEVSYSQVLQQKTNKLLTALILLLIVLLLIIGYVLIRIDAGDMITRIIYNY